MKDRSGFRSHVAIARTRVRDLPTRLGLAAFIGLTSWLIAPSLMPIVWFGAVMAGQAMDFAVFSRIRTQKTDRIPPGLKVFGSISVGLNAAIYSAIALYLWLEGGSTGQVFAMMQVAGGLLHVSLSLAGVRGWLMPALVAHGAYFLGLPAYGALAQGQPTDGLIVVGALLYMSHLAIAVTQTRRSARALEAAEALAREAASRAEAATVSKSDFLATISHEIRTPMNAVIASGQLLERTRLDDGQKGHVAMLVDAGGFLMHLLDEVLDYSKIEAGKMSLNATPVDAGETLVALERLWGPKAAQRSVALALSLDASVPPTLEFDGLRFRQIMSNLMSNAIKFTTEGEVRIHAVWNKDSGDLIVRVTDTGCGIDPDRAAAVFEAFEQAHASTTRTFGGTGLGLAISRRLAQLMGGDITLETEVGRGSTFTLRCPAAVVEAEQDGAKDARQDAALTGCRILIAEDHAINQKILALYLEPLGCRLTFVDDGQKAVEAAANGAFDLILMDMQMPVMGGLEAARAIRAAGAAEAVPIVAVTANALDSHRAAWAEVGAAGFLAKPIEYDAMVALLTRTLGGRSEDEAKAA